MPTRIYESVIPAPLQAVWDLYQDVHRALPALSPPGARVRIESADLPPVVGARIVITVRGPLGRPIRWVARIVEHRPPHAVVFGAEARWVDEQEEGPFAAWRHEHEFEAIDDKTTRLLDRITYRPPGGPAGWLLDALLIRWKLWSMFRHRHRTTRQLLGTSPTPWPRGR
jgi:ligand-binding SRPBCC domain-containing protein